MVNPRKNSVKCYAAFAMSKSVNITELSEKLTLIVLAPLSHSCLSCIKQPREGRNDLLNI